MGKFGTREWAEKNANIYRGCEHDCKYCYARYNAIVRFKTVKSREDWKHPVLNKSLLNKPIRPMLTGRIMFPTQHDITPNQLEPTIQYLRKNLEIGNHILIVSKPHLEVIKRICDEFKEFKKQIVFRFTIGSPNKDVLKFWEPNAPDYEERKQALKYAFENGFETSVSCEPILDEDISKLVKDLLPYISDTIWLGKMNFIKPRVDTSTWAVMDFDYLKKVERVIQDDFIKGLYDEFKNEPKVKWKESIKKVLGLPDEDGVA